MSKIIRKIKELLKNGEPRKPSLGGEVYPFPECTCHYIFQEEGKELPTVQFSDICFARFSSRTAITELRLFVNQIKLGEWSFENEQQLFAAKVYIGWVIHGSVFKDCFSNKSSNYWEVGFKMNCNKSAQKLFAAMTAIRMSWEYQRVDFVSLWEMCVEAGINPNAAIIVASCFYKDGEGYRPYTYTVNHGIASYSSNRIDNIKKFQEGKLEWNDVPVNEKYTPYRGVSDLFQKGDGENVEQLLKKFSKITGEGWNAVYTIPAAEIKNVLSEIAKEIENA